MVARPSVPQEVTLLVQRVADGQASDRDLERYAALLESDPDLAFEVEALQELSGTIREGLLEAGREEDFRAMQASVFQALATPAHRPGLVERLAVALRETWEHQRALFVPLGAVAAAAAMAVVLPRFADTTGLTAPELSVSAAAEVRTLDTSDTTAVVFQAPGSGVTVIWLAGADDQLDEDEEEEDLVDQDMPSEVESEVAEEDATAMP